MSSLIKPKAAQNIAKLALMGIGSILIGTIIKVEKNLSQRIDEHYADQKPESETDQAN